MDDDEIKELIEDDPDITMPVDPEREMREYILQEPKNWDMINEVILKAPDWLKEIMIKVLAEASSSINLIPAVPALINAFKGANHVREDNLTNTLTKIGESAVPYLIDALEDENVDVRWNAATILGEIAEKGGDCSAAVPALIDALKDENVDVRANGARVLGTVGNFSAVPALIDTLKDENLEVQEFVAEALIAIADRKVHKKDYVSALKIIKNSIRIVRGHYQGKKDTGSMLDRREILEKFDSFTNRIHDKMNPDKKKFPVKRAEIRKIQKRKIATC